MPTSVTLPALGESVTEGTVTRWLKQEGDTVEADEPLLEVSTDKVDTEIPSPAAGTLLSITVHEDETVEVGAELAVIGDASEGSGETSAETGDDTGEATGGEGAAARNDAPADASGAGDGAGGQAGEQAAGPAGGAGEGTGDDRGNAAASSGGSGGGATGGGSAGSRGVSVTLPALGESVTEGTVTRWLKQEGDTVEADEPLLEVSTDKVDTEIPSPAAGTLISITVHEDETVEVGAELAVIGDASGGAETGGGTGGEEASHDAGDGTGGGDDVAGSADASDADAGTAVATDEQPAAVAEKAAAELQPQPSREQPTQQQAPEQPRSDTGPEGAQPAQPQPAQGQPASQPDQAQQGGQAQRDRDGAPSAAGPAADQPAGADGAYVTPLVRKLAAERGVDLESLSGTGVGGRIRKQDVLEAAAAAEATAESGQTAPVAAAPSSGPAPGTPAGAVGAPADSASLRGQTVPMPRMRQFIARRMVESLQVSAQLTTVVEVDVTQIARLRDRAKADFQAREGVKLSFLPFFAKAANEALRAYPQVNASINAETKEVTYHGAEHLGIAVDTERGLIVPVIHNAGDLNIGGLARKIADLAERTRSNKVSPDELSGGTFTLTNTGSRGALFDTPILNQPQVGILGTGAVVKRPVVVDDARLGETIVVRSMMYLALTYDHRLVDGADAARFLTAMKQRLEEGRFESDLGL